MNVAVLGCGPAGLLCAWAVEQQGHKVHIISEKKKSEIPGSQHLHGSIPGITSPYPEGTIQFIRIGYAEEYAKKVYDDPERQTGWEHYMQVFPSWNVIKAYDKLWSHFETRIDDQKVSGIVSGDVADPREIILGHDLTISTLPAQALCYKPHAHEFESVPYFIKKLPLSEYDRDHEVVVYNGLPDDDWYRWSILGGLCSIESMVEPEGDYIVGVKAIDSNCTCWPKIVRCGRWAEWRHGVTMHQAYIKASETVYNMVPVQ